MSRWFRFHDDALDHPKVQRLAPDLFKFWVNLLCLASRNEGAIPPVEDVAFSLRVSEKVAGQNVDALVAAGLLDLSDDDVPVPHNWEQRQYKSDVSTERVKRFRKRREPVAETPPDTEQITETDSLREKRARDDAERTEFDSVFWPTYPHKVEKPAAIKAWRGARKKASCEDIVSGLERYIQAKPPDRSWCNPATFLNQERWADLPAEIAERANGNGQRTTTASLARQAAEEFRRREGERSDGSNLPAVVELSRAG